MVAMKSPLNDLKMDEQTSLYVGVLERQLMGLTINDARYRALLELLTGEEWDDMKTDFEDGEIKKIAIASLEKKLGISNEAARKIVRDRIIAQQKEERNAN